MNNLLISFLGKQKAAFAFTSLLFLTLFFVGLITNTAYSQAFRTTWITTDGTITTPTNTTNYTYNYNITWTNLTNAGVNEGSATAQTADYTITGLENNSTYEIAISGDFPHFYMNSNTTERTKIRTIEEWGTNSWTSMEGAFTGCINLTYNATDIPNLSAVTNMYAMFAGCSSFNGDIGSWDTQNVTDMSAMFINANSFNQPIGNWNTENVTNMSSMFFYADNFNQPIGNWNTQNVNNMSEIFDGCSSFNGDIGNWNTQNITDMSIMFNRAINFNQDIGNWNT